jgi:hypothetical protein
MVMRVPAVRYRSSARIRPAVRDRRRIGQLLPSQRTRTVALRDAVTRSRVIRAPRAATAPRMRITGNGAMNARRGKASASDTEPEPGRGPGVTGVAPADANVGPRALPSGVGVGPGAGDGVGPGVGPGAGPGAGPGRGGGTAMTGADGGDMASSVKVSLFAVAFTKSESPMSAAPGM